MYFSFFILHGWGKRSAAQPQTIYSEVPKNCSTEKGLSHCYQCDADCKKGLLSKIKPYAFTQFVKRYGEEKLLDCLEENEKNGVVYHRNGINGDYDDFEDVEQLVQFILTGQR